MKAYYGNRFSPNMTKTPEGFLICHNVPVARTGWQNYMPREIGESGSGLIKVFRSEEEVFSPATIASFEGKAVTDDHPPVGVDPSNYAAYLKGAVQSVRRGSGDLIDCLVADLVIHDAVLISEIETGKREVSCGYDCAYKANSDGTYKQTHIIGNHIAIVKNGRAGHKIAIQDSEPQEIKEEQKSMKKGNILDRMFSVFCKDADPEEIKEAADAINSAKDEDPKKKEEPEKKETTDTGREIERMKAQIVALEGKFSAKDSGEETKEEKTALDELEEELAKDTEEESVTVPAEKVKDEEPKEDEKASTADSAPILSVIRAMKPIVAALPVAQRKSVSDAMSKAVRDAMAVKPNQQANYAEMTKRKTIDAAADTQNKAAFGEACRKRNPHYKGDK